MYAHRTLTGRYKTPQAKREAPALSLYWDLSQERQSTLVAFARHDVVHCRPAFERALKQPIAKEVLPRNH